MYTLCSHILRTYILTAPMTYLCELFHFIYGILFLLISIFEDFPSSRFVKRPRGRGSENPGHVQPACRWEKVGLFITKESVWLSCPDVVYILLEFRSSIVNSHLKNLKSKRLCETITSLQWLPWPILFCFSSVYIVDNEKDIDANMAVVTSTGSWLRALGPARRALTACLVASTPTWTHRPSRRNKKP